MHPQHERSRLRRQHMVQFEGALTLGGRGSLLAWREPGGPASARRWQAVEAGVDPRPPRARLTLATSDGAGTLHFLMLVPPRSGKLRLETDDGKVALAVEPMAAPPLAVGELARGLATTERRRLLGWLLGVCPALFGLATEPEFGFAVRDLLQALLPETPPGSALRRCHLPGRWTLVQTVVGNGFQSGRLEGFVIGGTGGLRRAVVAPIAPDPSAAGRHPLLAAFEDHAPADVATFVLIGAGGVTCRRIEPAGSRLPAAAEWIAAVAAEGRRSVRDGALDALAILAERKAATPSYGALVREVLRVAPPPPPAFQGGVRATLSIVADLDRQILVVGNLGDPDGLVAGLRLRRLGAPEVEFRRTDLLVGPCVEAGLERTFAAASASRGPGNPHVPWRGHLVLDSGTELPIGEAPALVGHADPLERFLEAAAPLSAVPDAWPILEPAARGAASASLAKRRTVRTLVQGPALLRPRACLLLPLRRAAEAVRVVAMLAAEPAGRAVELVLVALETDPGLEIEVANLAASHGLAVRLVLPTMPLPAADVPIIGIEASEAPVIISVGLGIVPRVRGWLASLLSELSPTDDRAAGLALAGLRLAGQPDPGPLPSLAVVAGIRRDALTAVGGLADDWLDPEHRDADLALRLLAGGYRARILSGPNCVDTGLAVASRTAAAARLAAVLDQRRLARVAAEYRQRRVSPAAMPRSERLVAAR